jgi:hypothetical protein
MAERRMFAKTIVLSDAFLDMPLSARCLYFTLGMLADDDGFVNSPKSIMRQAGASTDDLNLLMAKRFILAFDSGVIVIKHWRIHNYIQKDRYKESKYIDEKATLTLDQNGAYTECIQDVSTLDTQVRLGKDRDRLELGEGSVGEDKEEAAPPTRAKRFIPPTVDEVRAYCQDRQNGVDPQRFVDYYSSNGWMVGKNKMKDWKAAVRTWEQKDKQYGRPAPKSSNPFLDMLSEGDYE